jgi:hypothetical protein
MRNRLPGVGGLFEFRNYNQYVVAPGSVHPLGLTYRWLNDAPIIEMPDWLVDVITKARFRVEAGIREGCKYTRCENT